MVFLNNLNFDFIIPIIFAIIILFGFFIGMINGFKASLFLLLGGILNLLITFFIIKYFWSSIKNLIPDNIKINDFPISKILKTENSMVENALKLLTLSVSFSAINSMMWILYLIFRKRLKSKLIKNKKLGKRMWKNRILGGFTSIIFTFIIAVIYTSVMSYFGNKNKFDDFLSKAIYYISIGEIKNLNFELRNINAIIKDINDIRSNLGALESIFGATKIAEPDALKNLMNDSDSRKSLQSFLTNPLLIKNMDIIEKLLPKNISENITIDGSLNGILPVQKPLDITVAEVRDFGEKMAKTFKGVQSSQDFIDFLLAAKIIKE